MMHEQTMPAPAPIVVLALGLTLCANSSDAQHPAAQAPPPPSSTATSRVPSGSMTADEASSYSLGLTFGGQLHHGGVGQNLSMEALIRGIQDGLRGRAVTADDKQRAGLLLRSARDSVGATNKTQARDFLAKNSKTEGVKTTASGLQYRILAAGNPDAESPKSTDEVTLQYRGRLLDGTEFDSSYAHGNAAKFKLNSVIKGWQEALLMMKPGAKWKLFVPPELAYDNYPPPNIPPGSLLIFEIDLLTAGPSAPANEKHPAVPPKPAVPQS